MTNVTKDGLLAGTHEFIAQHGHDTNILAIRAKLEAVDSAEDMSNIHVEMAVSKVLGDSTHKAEYKALGHEIRDKVQSIMGDFIV